MEKRTRTESKGKTARELWAASDKMQNSMEVCGTKAQLIYRNNRAGQLARMAIDALQTELGKTLTDLEAVKILAKGEML